MPSWAPVEADADEPAPLFSISSVTAAFDDNNVDEHGTSKARGDDAAAARNPRLVATPRTPDVVKKKTRARRLRRKRDGIDDDEPLSTLLVEKKTKKRVRRRRRRDDEDDDTQQSAEPATEPALRKKKRRRKLPPVKPATSAAGEDEDLDDEDLVDEDDENLSKTTQKKKKKKKKYKTWNQQFNDLCDYVRQHGHANVPAHPTSLGKWVQQQRKYYADQQQHLSQSSSPSSAEGTSASASAAESAKAAAAVKFEEKEKQKRGRTKKDEKKKKHGRPKKNDDAAAAAASVLTSERISALEQIGFAWRIVQRTPWERRLDELKAFKLQEGHANVPPSYTASRALANWVSSQRVHYRRMQAGQESKMTEERVEALESIGFEWNPGQARTSWEDRLEELKQYRNEHGHVNVPQKHENRGLANWVTMQRVRYRKRNDGGNNDRWSSSNTPNSAMTDAQLQALESIGFEWTPSQWHARIKELREYKARHGHIHVSCAKPRHALGPWLDRVRKNYREMKKGKASTFLTEARVKELEEIGMEWHPKRGPKRDPTKSPKKEPKKSPKKVPKKSPKKSSQKGPRKSPKKSPKKGLKKSPKKGPKV